MPPLHSSYTVPWYLRRYQQLWIQQLILFAFTFWQKYFQFCVPNLESEKLVHTTLGPKMFGVGDYPRTNPWNFREKVLRFGGFENLSLFEFWIIFQKKQKNASSSRKLGTNYGVEWMGLNFYDYCGLQPKITHHKHFWPQCRNKILFLLNFSIMWWKEGRAYGGNSIKIKYYFHTLGSMPLQISACATVLLPYSFFFWNWWRFEILQIFFQHFLKLKNN